MRRVALSAYGILCMFTSITFSDVLTLKFKLTRLKSIDIEVSAKKRMAVNVSSILLSILLHEVSKSILKVDITNSGIFDSKACQVV
jgi:hypothetical protein